MRVCVRACVHACVRVCACVRACMRACVRVCVCVHACVCMRACMRACVRVCTFMLRDRGMGVTREVFCRGAQCWIEVLLLFSTAPVLSFYWIYSSLPPLPFPFSSSLPSFSSLLSFPISPSLLLLLPHLPPPSSHHPPPNMNHRNKRRTSVSWRWRG